MIAANVRRSSGGTEPNFPDHTRSRGRNIITSLYGSCVYPRREILHQLGLRLRSRHRRAGPLYSRLSRFVVPFAAPDQRHPRRPNGDPAQGLDAVLRGNGDAGLRRGVLRHLRTGAEGWRSISEATPPSGTYGTGPGPLSADRKSTRLNSSHSQISYAV